MRKGIIKAKFKANGTDIGFINEVFTSQGTLQVTANSSCSMVIEAQIDCWWKQKHHWKRKLSPGAQAGLVPFYVQVSFGMFPPLDYLLFLPPPEIHYLFIWGVLRFLSVDCMLLI